MRVAIHTRLKADGVEGYEAAHDDIPVEVVALLRAGGAREWTIWRNGLDLFHLVECEDWEALEAFMSDKAADQAWQARVGEFRDFSLAGGDLPMKLIFSLPDAEKVG